MAVSHLLNKPPKAMILAAGLGARLKPWTDTHPKALAIVNGKSLLQRNIEYLQKHGINEVIINVHHFADQIVSAIEQYQGWGSTVTISDETNEVLETGGGLKKAAWYFKSEQDFVLMNVDILTDLDITAMVHQHRVHQALATLAVSERDTSRYFLFDEGDLLKGWRNVKTGEEKPFFAMSDGQSNAFRQKAFSGIHVISEAIFPLITQEGKFSMVDVYLNLLNKYTIRAFDHTGNQFIDVGKQESIHKAEAIFK